jgi:hypothetical protein
MEDAMKSGKNGMSRAERTPIRVLAEFLELAVMTPPQTLDFIGSVVDGVTPDLFDDELARLKQMAARLELACDLALEERARRRPKSARQAL